MTAVASAQPRPRKSHIWDREANEHYVEPACSKEKGRALIERSPMVVFTRRHLPSSDRNVARHGIAAGHVASHRPNIDQIAENANGAARAYGHVPGRVSAAGEGFEPPQDMTPVPIKNRLPSTTRPTRLTSGVAKPRNNVKEFQAE